MSRLLRLLALLALLVPAGVRADDIWSWTDAEGEVHYTNDLASIPERYKKTVRTVGSDKSGPEVQVVGKDDGKPKDREPPPETTMAPQPPPPEPIETAIRPPRDDEKASEQEWRTLFRKANDRVKRAERQLQRTRDAISKLPGSDFTSYDYMGNVVVESRSQALRLQLDEDQRNLDDSREQLHDLERAAARDAIPLEWRR
jgi:hypothetical protein